jgi:hypothetical protein
MFWFFSGFRGETINLGEGSGEDDFGFWFGHYALVSSFAVGKERDESIAPMLMLLLVRHWKRIKVNATSINGPLAGPSLHDTQKYKVKWRHLFSWQCSDAHHSINIKCISQSFTIYWHPCIWTRAHCTCTLWHFIKPHPKFEEGGVGRHEQGKREQRHIAHKKGDRWTQTQE